MSLSRSGSSRALTRRSADNDGSGSGDTGVHLAAQSREDDVPLTTNATPDDTTPPDTLVPDIVVDAVNVDSGKDAGVAQRSDDVDEDTSRRQSQEVAGLRQTTSAIMRDTRTNAKQMNRNLVDESNGKNVLSLMSEEIGPVSLKDSVSQADTLDRSATVVDRQSAVSDKPSTGAQPKVFGMRVEQHAKGLVLENGVFTLLVGYPATLRLFGEGLTEDMEVLFTAEAADYGDTCTIRTSAAFQVSCYWRLVGLCYQSEYVAGQLTTLYVNT